MGRKRLNHSADILCQMFCGWRLIDSMNDLVALGSGDLEIDVMSGKCRFDGKDTAELSIAIELREWLKGDLNAHKIPRDAVDSAILRVGIELRSIPSGERRPAKEQFLGKDGNRVESATFHQGIFKCVSEIKSGGYTYSATYDDVQQWPLGWPVERATSPKT